MSKLQEKAKIFRALHQRDYPFIIPNPWDFGSARLLANLGFEALATTSMGYAFSRGQLDNTVDRRQVMLHASEIASATNLPVSADLENGFGDAPEVVAETIRIASETGIVGGSIEDSTSRTSDPIYDLGLAKDRIQAAVEAARSLPFPFTLTARAENYLHGRPDIKDTILRLQAYQQAGADVLYAPGLASRDEIAAVVSSVDRPVNVVMGLRGIPLSVTELASLGVKRISVGGSLYRTAIAAFLSAVREMKEHGTFTFAAKAASPKEIGSMLQG